MRMTTPGMRTSACLIIAAVACAKTHSQLTFASPNEAADELVVAVESGNYRLFLSIVGPGMAGFWSTGDALRDAVERDRFLDAARRNDIKIQAQTQNRQILYVGAVENPFPAPLMKTESGWMFDGDAGSRELAARRLRRNETAAVEQCRRFRDAEFDYLGLDNGGHPAFAQRIRSSQGLHDGLFWSDSGEVDESPLGPSFAAAALAEKLPDEVPHPLFGYYFKVLVAQGPSAYGGTHDYRVNGKLRKGFALIAWPAKYGVDGLHSFLINYFGDVYEKNMGPDTNRKAKSMVVFDPDRSWTAFVEDDGRPLCPYPDGTGLVSRK